jgi:hypothetical protein
MSSLPFLNSATPTSDVSSGKSGEVLGGAVDDIIESDTTPLSRISSPSICSTSSPSPPTTGYDISLHERLGTLYSSRPSPPPPSSSSSTSALSSGSLSNNTTGAIVDGVNDKTEQCKTSVSAEKESDNEPKVRIKGDKLSVQLPINRSRDAQRYNVVLEIPSSESSDGCTTKASVKRVGLSDGGSDCVGYCSVCLVRPSNCVFLPCGHIKTCIKCGSSLYLRKMKCPVCRKMMRLRPHQVYM